MSALHVDAHESTLTDYTHDYKSFINTELGNINKLLDILDIFVNKCCKHQNEKYSKLYKYMQNTYYVIILPS